MRRLLRFNPWLRWLWLGLALALVARHLAGPSAASSGPLWWLAAGLAYYWFVTAGMSVGMHRLFTHRSFRTTRGWEAVLLGTLVVSLAGVPFAWSRAHLRHHQSADTPADPYRVKSHGWRSIFLPFDPALTREYVERWLTDPLQRRANAWYNAWVALWLGALWLLGGERALVFLWALPVVLLHSVRQLFFHYCIHTWGYRSHATPDDSRNNWLVALLAGGEGWHNNHHHRPAAWSFAERWWELDPGAWLVGLIRLRDEPSSVPRRSHP